VPPAEIVIQRLSAAGIVQLTPDVEFAHPLFATYLGAQHASRAQPLSDSMAADPEFAVFVAALLGDDRMDEKLTHLLRHGAVGQARYLRLVAEAPREPQPQDPLTFGRAVETFTGLAAECIVTDEWTAWRTSEEPGIGKPDAVRAWLSAGEVNFLTGHVFKRRSPVDVAVIESLARFKHHVVLRRPHESQFTRLPESELKRLRKLPKRDLEEMILQAAVDWRKEWRAQASELRIASIPETAIDDGDPCVTVYETWPDPRLRLDWGASARVVWSQPEMLRLAGVPLSHFLEPGRSARVYDDLIKRAERALGCAFGSQTWNRPELVASWAW
jgi:hypothetical protein